MLRRSLALAVVASGFAVWAVGRSDAPPAVDADYAGVVRPLMAKYCLGCHSTEAKKGSLDLERFGSIEHIRKDVKPWQQTIEMLEAGEMPPKNKPQPTATERKTIIAWIHRFLETEARARAGDPGYVPLRRLSNAEYDATVRDLTGVDLRPTREFPADGAAGEGFTNAAEALTEISPALLTKYLNAAKDIAEHAVLLPDGLRFSPGKTRRDWTDESLAKLRAFYADHTADGKLPLAPYLLATVRHRDALAAEKVADVAAKEKLNAKYLGILWKALTDPTPSYPLEPIRARWRKAGEKDVGALAAEIAAWQVALWRVVPVGSYRYGNTVRQVAKNPEAVATRSLNVAPEVAPGQTDVVLYLVARDIGASGGKVVWQQPRFEGGDDPLLLRDYAKFGPAFEVDYAAVFADSPKYLAAAAETIDRKRSVDDIAKSHGLDAVFLKRWVEVLALLPPENPGRVVPAVALEPLDEKVANLGNKPAVNGWRKKGTDLPSLMTNASDVVEQIPGRVSPHGVAAHPMPKEFVAAVWKSPIAGTVRVEWKVAHAHPACGNGVAWWLEHRRANRAAVLAEGAIDLGRDAKPPAVTLKVEKGDLLTLAVDARDGNHVCDLTEMTLTVREDADPRRTWDLARDIAGSVLDGNPHADTLGNKDVWSFVRGPSRPVGKGEGVMIPAESSLGRWREVAADPARKDEAARLADRVRSLLSGPRPAKEQDPDRVLFDNLLSSESSLLNGVDLSRFRKPSGNRYGLAGGRFRDDGSLVVAADSVTEVRLPARLFREHEFVAEAKIDGDPADRAVRFEVLTAPPDGVAPWDGSSVVAGPGGHKRVLAGHDAFRQLFPMFLCFPRVIPDDEVVCLKMYHREDEPLARLFLDDAQRRRIDTLWNEHRFISRQPVAENDYLPQFIGFVTQDQPKELLAYFEGQRGAFRKRAEDFENEAAAAVPKQLDALLDFASRAYRRPLTGAEKSELLGLHRALRDKGVSHQEAFRGVLSRVLVSPAFLFRVEKAPPGKEPGPVDDWELATRLSYFLWSSAPDDELRAVAAAGKLRDPETLAAQSRRMTKDGRVRSLAVEFGAQWIHVRGFDAFSEKNEKLFPTFDAAMRAAVYEESVLFFLDLFQSDRPVSTVLDADHTFLNETLAKHYGIPGVSGPGWRRVDGVRKFGRGGILGLASVQAKQSGASRTSPVLRGNWVVETLLGEKLPRPPADVPQLPEEEGGADKLTVRAMVEKHAKAAECAVCHTRIDPFGFALERYDPIGRRRDADLGGLPIDSKAKLKDGTEFDGIDGLRDYLLAKKKDVIVRLFCRKLLGYALGRSIDLSDQVLIDEMVTQLNKHGGKFSAAVDVIVRSPQFRMVRGRDYPVPE